MAPNTDPGGLRWTPAIALLRTETADATNTCEMFGIWGRPKCARVKLNHCAGWTYGTVAPRHGFEPRFTAPKAAVLPLDDRGVLLLALFPQSSGSDRDLQRPPDIIGTSPGARQPSDEIAASSWGVTWSHA